MQAQVGVTPPKDRLQETSMHQLCPTYQLHSLPKRSTWGPQTAENGVGPGVPGHSNFHKKKNWSGEFRVVPAGDPILVIWGGFLGDMRMAKVDMLGRGDQRMHDKTTEGATLRRGEHSCRRRNQEPCART